MAHVIGYTLRGRRLVLSRVVGAEAQLCATHRKRLVEAGRHGCRLGLHRRDVPAGLAAIEVQPGGHALAGHGRRLASDRTLGHEERHLGPLLEEDHFVCGRTE